MFGEVSFFGKKVVGFELARLGQSHSLPAHDVATRLGVSLGASSADGCVGLLSIGGVNLPVTEAVLVGKERTALSGWGGTADLLLRIDLPYLNAPEWSKFVDCAVIARVPRKVEFRTPVNSPSLWRSELVGYVRETSLNVQYRDGEEAHIRSIVAVSIIGGAKLSPQPERDENAPALYRKKTEVYAARWDGTLLGAISCAGMQEHDMTGKCISFTRNGAIVFYCYGNVRNGDVTVAPDQWLVCDGGRLAVFVDEHFRAHYERK